MQRKKQENIETAENHKSYKKYALVSETPQISRIFASQHIKVILTHKHIRDFIASLYLLVKE